MPKLIQRVDETKQLELLTGIDNLVESLSEIQGVADELESKGFTRTRVGLLQRLLRTARGDLRLMRNNAEESAGKALVTVHKQLNAESRALTRSKVGWGGLCLPFSGGRC